MARLSNSWRVARFDLHFKPFKFMARIFLVFKFVAHLIAVTVRIYQMTVILAGTTATTLALEKAIA